MLDDVEGNWWFQQFVDALGFNRSWFRLDGAQTGRVGGIVRKMTVPKWRVLLDALREQGGMKDFIFPCIGWFALGPESKLWEQSTIELFQSLKIPNDHQGGFVQILRLARESFVPLTEGV
jgi:hypothetical protein